LISAGLEWGFELKQRHGTTFRSLSYHRKQHCAQQRAGQTWTEPRDTTELQKSSVVSRLLNIVNAWTQRPRLQADELIPDSRPRGIVGPMARHFVGAVDGEPALR